MNAADFQPKPFRVAPVAFGVALVLLGLLLFADRTAPDLAHRVAHWWPLLLTLVGVGRLVDRGPFHVGGHLLIGLSLVLLAGSFDRADLVHRYWPLGLIWLGLIIAGRGLRPQASRKDSGNSPEGEA